jgi:hypothetical protein
MTGEWQDPSDSPIASWRLQSYGQEWQIACV